MSVALAAPGHASPLAPSAPNARLEERIHAIHQALAMAPSLQPGERVNGLFCELVALALSSPADDGARALGDPIVRAIQESLWHICARGEAELEGHWAERVVQSDDPWSTLRSFPYFANYVRLTRLEAHALCAVSEGAPRRVLFVGCGPLPLTALLLSCTHGFRVCAIDVDARACALAQRVADALGAPSLEIEHADARTCAGLAHSDVVILAALAGLRAREKRALTRHLAAVMRAGSLLLLRSAHTLRALLYPVVEPGSLDPFERVLEIHPHDDVVNSILIVRATGVGLAGAGRRAEVAWRSC